MRSPQKRHMAALAVALLISLVVHFGTALMFVTFGGEPHAGGENGHEGAGDVTMDITVEGPRAEQLQPAIAAVEPTPPTPEVDTPTPAPPTPPRPPAPPVSVASRGAVAVRETAPEARTPEATETSRTPETSAVPAHPSAPATGTNDTQTSGGQASGAAAVRALILGSAGFMPTSVEGQRALLPAATTCADPVTGVWRALKYSPTFGGQWVRFTLLIRRGEGTDELVGTIRSRIWSGRPSDRTPPACTYGQIDTTHAMVAHGRVRGDDISFGSHTYRLVTDHCPQLFASSTGYAPDNFSGTLDTMRQEFQSVNNDGAYDINTPYVFRRVGCLEERDGTGDSTE